MKERLQEAFQNFYYAVIEEIPDVIVGLVALIIFIILGILIRNFIRRRFLQKVEDRLVINFIGRVILLLFIVFGIVTFLNQVGLGGAASGLLAGAGLSALIVGFAFKDIGENLLSGFMLAFSRPFGIGDVIKLQEYTGNVKALTFRNTHIRTFDGKDVYLPNSMIIKNPLVNFTRDGLMRHEFVIGVDYGDNISEAIRIILDELDNTAEISHEKQLKPFVTLDAYGTSTINLRVFFWINTYDFQGSVLTLKSLVMERVGKRLIKEGFNLPADIVELKIYQENRPIPIALKDFQEKSKPI